MKINQRQLLVKLEQHIEQLDLQASKIEPKHPVKQNQKPVVRQYSTIIKSKDC